MKLLIFTFILFTQSAFAEYDGNVVIDTNNNRVNKTIIEWKQTNDIISACERESRKRGLGGFKGSRMEACSFWVFDGNIGTCTIITERKTTLDTIGHEFAHCTQGDWH
jgi:hypothetical protein